MKVSLSVTGTANEHLTAYEIAGYEFSLTEVAAKLAVGWAAVEGTLANSLMVGNGGENVGGVRRSRQERALHKNGRSRITASDLSR